MNVRRVLDRWGLQPQKGLGQNFLADSRILQKIVDAADLDPHDVVVEIGAGIGNLTELLASRARTVVAVELDRQLIPVLKENLRGFENVVLVQGDILDLDPAELVWQATHGQEIYGDYKVVANLPYYITSAVLRHLLEASLRPARLVITVQLEVARRIVAQPGDMSVLAVSVQFYGRPKILFRIKPGSFYPAPTVESAVLQVDSYAIPPVPVEDPKTLFRAVRAGFAQRRKQLRNTLSAGLGISPDEVVILLESLSIDPRRRAETLTLDEWSGIALGIRNLEDG
jgi:16S rRNA (adenine1518-N6/adenine1519-N6)-dimethyltransferase